ncbi:MAG: hypothetical protein ACE5J5_04115 [Candidatus Hydrothermarchaeales archaeon]
MLTVDDWMKCPKCGQEVPKIEEYCPNCEQEIRAYVGSVPWWGLVGVTVMGTGFLISAITLKYVWTGVAIILSTPLLAVYYFKKRAVDRLTIIKK